MPTRHRVHVAEAQFQLTPSTTKYDRQIADWIDSIAATRRTGLSFAGTRKIVFSLAATRHKLIARGVSPWKPSPPFNLAATRRQNHSEKADATIIWESLLSSHLQHEKSGTDHHRGSGTKAIRVPWRHSPESRGQTGCGWRNERSHSFARLTLASSFDRRHGSGAEKQFLGMDSREFSRPAIICLASRLWSIFGKLFRTRRGSSVSRQPKAAPYETNIPRRIPCVPPPARIGVRRTLRMGLISIGRDDHPVGVRRGVGGGRFQGFTPLAIHFRPFGTKNKTRCNPCPSIGCMLWIDSTSCIDSTSWIHPTSWIDATSWIRTESLIALSRNAAEVNSQGREPLETATSILLSRNAATVIFHINHQHQITRSGVTLNPFMRFRGGGSVVGDHVIRTVSHRRNTCEVKANRIAHPARIGVRRTLRMGLISIGRDDHPVGVRRGVGGGRFQGFTPLAIHFRPFGTKNKTRCNPCPSIGCMLWIDSTSCIDSTSWIHPTSWIDATSWIRTESLIALSRNAAEVNSQGREPLETVTSILLSRNAATVIFHINHRHQVTRTIVNRQLSERKKINRQNRLTPLAFHGLLNRQSTTLGHADNLKPTRETNLDQNSSNPHYRAINRTSGLVPSPRYSGERVRVRGLSLLRSRSESSPHQTRPTLRPSRPGVTRKSFVVSPHHRDLHPPVKKTSSARVPRAVPGISPPQNGSHLGRHESLATNDRSVEVIENPSGEIIARRLPWLATNVILVPSPLARKQSILIRSQNRMRRRTLRFTSTFVDTATANTIYSHSTPQSEMEKPNDD